MSNQSPSPETVIRRAFRIALRSVRVSLPGVITSYDPTTCQADVQPLMMEAQPQPDGSVVTAPLPVVPHCPVLFVGGGGSRLTFPVKVGNTCLILFASSAISRWLAIGGTEPIDPQDDRHHHITDGIAIVGLDDFENVSPANADATVLEGDDVRLGDDSGAALAFNGDLNTLMADVAGAVDFAAFKTALGGHFPSGAAGTQKVKAT